MTNTSSASTYPGRSTGIALVVVLLALGGLYRDTLGGMVGIWIRSDTFTHAFLVPPIVLWLIWEKRHLLARQSLNPTLWLAIPMAGLAFIWLLGELAAVNAVTQLAITAMLVLAVPLIIGLPAARTIAFPLAFLFFAVPIGEFVMPRLMDWTATVTVFGLRLTGIPVYQEGRHFVIPTGRWSVVEACSGVRYLIASLTVGTLFAYLNYRSLKRRLVFIGVSILVPILANWARAYLIVMLGHLSGNELATGADHLVYGWVFFGIVITIMFAIGMRWREAEADMSAATALAGENSPASGPAFGRLALALALVLGIALVPRAALKIMDAAAPPPPLLMPQALATAGWRVAEEPLFGWKPAFANPSTAMSATLDNGPRCIGVHIAYYRQQNYERKLVSSDNVLVKSDDKDWALVAQGSRPITLGGQTVTARSGHLRSQGFALGAEPVRLVAWHWYWIDGRLTTNDYLAKAWLALARLRGRGDDSAAVVIFAPEGAPGAAEASLDSYLASAGGGITAVLEHARGQR